MGWNVSCAYLVYCLSIILFRMSLAMDPSIARLILNSVRLSQYTRHAASAPTQRNDINH